MQLNKVNTITLAVSVGINAILMFLLLIKFSTSPADILRELQRTELNISLELAQTKATEERILSVLADRKRWSIELTEALKKGFDGGVFIAPTPPQ